MASVRYRFGRARRLKKPSDFASVARRATIRAASSWLSIMTALSPAEADHIGVARFGITVGRRNARRAVDRTLIKRIVREACRHQASKFELAAIAAAARVDVVLRVKSPLIGDDSKPLAMRRWRRQLRQEADELLEKVLNELTRRAARAER